MPETTDGPREPKIPVFLLTGFLGSGKTTLLSQILRDPRFSDTAVIINEFGEVGLDHFLVSHSPEQMVEMTSGCLCCTIRGDIRRTLLDLHARRAAGRIPVFSRLVVETTGLADPAPVLHTFMTDRRLADRFVLSGVVAAVDAVNGLETLSRRPECVKQVAVADRLVLTKSDLLADQPRAGALAALMRRLRRLNPGVTIHDRAGASFDAAGMFDASPYDPGTKSAEVRRWLNEEAYETADGHGYGHHHDHSHGHGHDVNRHGEDIHAYALVLDEPVDAMTFSVALEMLVANQGADMLRFKGIVHLADAPGRPVILHGVQHVFHEPVQLDEWEGDMRTRLVLITRNLPKEAVQAFFDAWQSVRIDDADALPGLEASA
jgi:G3E family GTPase